MELLACEMGTAAQEEDLDNTGKTEKSLVGNCSVPEGEQSLIYAWFCLTALLSRTPSSGLKARW